MSKATVIRFPERSNFSHVTAFFAIGRRVTFSVRAFRFLTETTDREELVFEFDEPLTGNRDYFDWHLLVEFIQKMMTAEWSDHTPVFSEGEISSMRWLDSLEYSVEVLDYVVKICEGNLKT